MYFSNEPRNRQTDHLRQNNSRNIHNFENGSNNIIFYKRNNNNVILNNNSNSNNSNNRNNNRNKKIFNYKGKNISLTFRGDNDHISKKIIF